MTGVSVAFSLYLLIYNIPHTPIAILYGFAVGAFAYIGIQYTGKNKEMLEKKKSS